MAVFQTKTFLKHDDYMTPKYAWENISAYIPKNKVIWEAFYGDGASGKHLKELGFNVIHDPIDFFENNLGDIVVTNPPFSKSKEVMSRLRNLFKDSNDKLQIIIPKKRIHFDKKIKGNTPKNWKNACNFDCFYYCWKMNLPRDIIWLD